MRERIVAMLKEHMASPSFALLGGRNAAGSATANSRSAPTAAVTSLTTRPAGSDTVLVVLPVVAREVAVVRRVLAILADPLVIAMFEHSKLPRRLPPLTMTRPLNLGMTLSQQN